MAQRLMKAPTIVRFSACLYQSRQWQNDNIQEQELTITMFSSIES